MTIRSNSTAVRVNRALRPGSRTGSTAHDSARGRSRSPRLSVRAAGRAAHRGPAVDRNGTPDRGRGVPHVLSGWHIGYLPVSYAERWVESGRMHSIMPATYRLNTRIELVTRRGVKLTLVSQTFADILRETTRQSRG